MVVFNHFPHPNTPEGHSIHLPEQWLTTEGIFYGERGSLSASPGKYVSLICPLIKNHLDRVLSIGIRTGQ